MNSNLKNLRWDTPKENQADMRKHGTAVIGEKCHFAKVTVEIAKHVQVLRAQGRTYREIAVEVGLSKSGVGHIVTGYSWSGVL